MNATSRLFRVLSLVALGVTLTACGETKDDARLNFDDDHDGLTPLEGDCDDSNAHANPDEVEACDGIDNDCDGVVDNGYDVDGDGYTTCGGDCRDHDATAYPEAHEEMDGVDNDCDRAIDNHSATFDDDGDGYTEDQGDCNDDPNNDGTLVGPGALEVAVDEDGHPEGIDNDCDGEIDETVPPCPAAGENTALPMNYALALDVCDQVLTASWRSSIDIDPRSHNIHRQFGATYVPAAGDTMAVLATGLTVPEGGPGWVRPQSGTSFLNNIAHPDPGEPTVCNDGFGDQTFEDPPDVNDYTELKLVLAVPTNARSFSFDFNFMSAEFPEFVCTTFDDTFIAYLDSAAYTGNVSFDSNGNRVSINIGFFDVCNVADGAGCTGAEDLVGTGYDFDGGGTGWLTTTAPVTPGEKISLTFMIWDEGDHIYDSLVLLDNFRWGVEQVDGPETVEKALPDEVEVSSHGGLDHQVR